MHVEQPPHIDLSYRYLNDDAIHRMTRKLHKTSDECSQLTEAHNEHKPYIIFIKALYTAVFALSAAPCRKSSFLSFIFFGYAVVCLPVSNHCVCVCARCVDFAPY